MIFSQSRVSPLRYPAGQLGNQSTIIIGSGVADAGVIAPSYEPNKLPLSSVAELKRIVFNAAADVTMKAGKKPRLRNTWFNRAERKALLEQASSAVRGRKEPWQRFEARRWVPWLCAYTGARVGEMVQLRKHDVRQVDEHWIIAISPEAITVKGGDGREVPIHPHLVEMGFLEFVKAAPEGFLFMWSGEGRKAWRTAKNRMVEVARLVVTDTNVQSNHGWRQTFKTIGLEAELPERVLDAICGHAAWTEGEKYGGSTVVAKGRAMERFPRYDAKAIVASGGTK